MLRVLSQTETAYWAVARTEAQYRLSESNLKVAESLLSEVRERERVGLTEHMLRASARRLDRIGCSHPPPYAPINLRQRASEWTESFRIAAEQLRAHEVLSLLTALGVIIGIVAVMLMGTAIKRIDRGFTDSLDMTTTLKSTARKRWRNNWARSRPASP